MLVGLSGYAGSGKDEVAKILSAHGFERVAFADGIRDCVYALNPSVQLPDSGLWWKIRTLAEVQGWEMVKRYPEVRGLLQRMGVEVGRQFFGEDVWLNVLARKVELAGERTNIVISDVRFGNELEWIREQGGEVWRITRPNYGPVNQHSSETALDTYFFDARLENNGTLAELEVQVKQSLADYWGKDN